MSRITKEASFAKACGTAQKSLPVYTLGFVLCIILTFIPFYLVIHNSVSKKALMAIIFTAAILQFFVQVVCFLRLNNNSQQGSINILTFLFTGIVTLTVIGGSLWIMISLNYFMMH